MKALAMDWSCRKKTTARRETIIEPFREVMGERLDRSFQYWTMCGKCFAEDGSPLPGCELDQVVEARLVDPEQFVGVDVDPAVVEGNARAWPGVRWLCDDFYTAMLSATSDRSFNPGIVNCDTPFRVERGARAMGNIMILLNSHARNDVMLVANVVGAVKYYGYESDPMSVLSENEAFRWAWQHGKWEFYKDAVYEYQGSGTNDLTTMCSLVFFKKA